MTEIFENEYGETWFYFHPSSHKGDGIYGWGSEDDAQKYLDVMNADLNPDEGEFWFVDQMTEEEFENISKPIDGFNINDKLLELRFEDDEDEDDDAAEFEAAVAAIKAWDGEDTGEIEGLVDAAEEAAYELAWDDDADELNESGYQISCDMIRMAAGETGTGCDQHPDWPELIAAGKDGLLLVVRENDPGEVRMSVGTQDNPDFEAEDEAA